MHKRVVCIINFFLIMILVCLLKWNSVKEAEFAESMRSANKAEIKRRIAIKEEIICYHDDLEEIVEEVLPGIICWGDSLTAGAGGDGITWPQTLKENISEKLLSNFDVEIIAEKSGERGTAKV